MSSIKCQHTGNTVTVRSSNLNVTSAPPGLIRKKISTNSIFYFKRFICQLLLVVLFLSFSYSLSKGAEITGLEVKVQDSEIYVTTFISLEEKHLREIKNGIKKELRFYIDLFRAWNLWPDEFILGKSFVRTIKCDPVKGEYIATSYDGSTLTEKRFKSFESMMRWASGINELKLTNIRELEPAIYFVRVTVESKIRNLPPVIGYFIIFLSENEFKVNKDSPPFKIEGAK